MNSFLRGSVRTVQIVVLSAAERAGYQPPGRFVAVNGKKIHLVTTGSGPRVILLSGLGTPVPWLDFQALQQELAAHAEVTTVEYPGYGPSDDTEEARTTSASVDELRSALTAAGLTPPYTLVVHSISGLQALDYASRFPDEVACVVGLESSLPGQLTYLSEPQADGTYAWLRNLGVLRWALALDPTLAGANTPERTLVYDDGIVKGFCLHGPCREHSSTAYEVMALYVEPAFLRHGVGTALLEQTEVLARKKGNPEMVLWVLETNTLGRSFYEKQGYTPGGVVEEDGLREVQYSKKL